jgi:hypothetical protein
MSLGPSRERKTHGVEFDEEGEENVEKLSEGRS